MFWMEDSNYQTTLLDMTHFAIYLANIPAVRSRGFEVDAAAEVFEGLSAVMSAAYTDAAYESYPNAPAPFEDYTVEAGKLNTNIAVDLTHRPLPAVSKWALSLGGEYSRKLNTWGLSDIVGYAGVDETLRSGYFTTASLSMYSFVPAYEVTNARIGLRAESGRWNIEFWSRNLFDRKYKITQAPLLFNSGALSAILGDPRTVGATLTMRY
jgi:iron complex outermembrane receptor protein